MALIVSNVFLKSTLASAGNASAVAPTDPIPDNCHTVIIFNPDAANTLYVAVGDAGDVLDPSGGGTTIPLSIKPEASATIGMGSLSLRPQNKHDGTNQLVYQASAGTIAANISYINSTEI
jgi:hypothetical protein